jgi:hypothetical protein
MRKKKIHVRGEYKQKAKTKSKNKKVSNKAKVQNI